MAASGRGNIDIYLATYSALAGLAEDERLLVSALQQLGVEASPASWDDPDVDWTQARTCIIRSTWNYHRKLNEFLLWAERTSEQTDLWNPLPAVRWNSHKLYLSELGERGIPVVPTLWLRHNRQADIGALMAGSGWTQAVLKPAVSASAEGTIIVTLATLDQAQTQAERLLQSGDAMLQPYVDSVETYGERSLVFFNGEYSHAVKRWPVLVQNGDEYIPEASVQPTPEELRVAAHTLKAANYNTLYARVDLAHYAGTPHLMELELVEPALFLRSAEGAVERFAAAIVERCF